MTRTTPAFHPRRPAAAITAGAALALSACVGPFASRTTVPRPVALALPAGVADSVRSEPLANGLQLHTLVNMTAPWRAYVLEIPMRCVQLQAVKGGPTSVGRTTTSALLASLPAARSPLAAINADFFLFAPPGVLTNAHIEDGTVITGPDVKPGFWVGDRGAMGFDTLRTTGTLQGRAGTLALRAWNRPAARTTGIVDGRWGAPLDTLVRKRLVKLVAVAGTPRQRATRGTGPTFATRAVVRPAQPGDTVAIGDTLLLHYSTADRALVAQLRDGDTVRIELAVSGAGVDRQRTRVAQAVGGRPLLLVDSLVVNDVETEGNAGFRGLNPRSALGFNRQRGTMWWVVIDGRRPGVTMGTSLRQTADLLRALGATEAMNLDGGGSSALVVREQASGRVRVTNSPSDPTERAVGNALAAYGTCGRR
ncbi:MAG: phosphodiester glycosidase family protein [Gemmatimonas sp.]